MTPTSFEFTVTLPVDSRLVGAIRQLAAHAAGYAQLAADAREALARHVERATKTAIASARTPAGLIGFEFSGDEGAVSIVITCDAAAGTPPPRSSSGEGVSVDWKADG